MGLCWVVSCECDCLIKNKETLKKYTVCFTMEKESLLRVDLKRMKDKREKLKCHRNINLGNSFRSFLWKKK